MNNGGLRRTASFSNIQIKEEANEDDEDELAGTTGAHTALSNEKQRILKRKVIALHEKYSKDAKNPLTLKAYF